MRTKVKAGQNKYDVTGQFLDLQMKMITLGGIAFILAVLSLIVGLLVFITNLH